MLAAALPAILVPPELAAATGELWRWLRGVSVAQNSYPRDNAREWSQIVALYASLPDCPFAVAMERLVRKLDENGFVAAGLHGTTSMLELNLGPASDVLNNPHLSIRPLDDRVQLTYEDGSEPPWSVQVGYDGLDHRVERFLVKRARWFRDNRDFGS